MNKMKPIEIRGFSPTAEQSLPIGNGLIGANVWVAEEGTVHILLNHAEAYSESSRLSKVGEVTLSFHHKAQTKGEILQTLTVEDGMLRITSEKDSHFEVTLFADSIQPVIRVGIRSGSPVICNAHVLLSRPHRRMVSQTSSSPWDYEESGSFLFLDLKQGCVAVEPDIFVPTPPNAVCWCHRNATSFLGNLAGNQKDHGGDDPLAGLTFGALMVGAGWQSESSSCLRSANGCHSTDFSIALHAEKCESVEQWQEQISAISNGLDSFENAQKKCVRTHTKRAEESFVRLSGTPEAEQVSRAYASQVYLSDCAGRGKWPIRFNGSMFNVAWKIEHANGKYENYDADYRRWHCGFWGQNTRLIYWPMLATGRFDLMLPYFDLYRDTLPAARHRARLLLGREGRGGAYFWETMNLWDNLEVLVLPEKTTSWRYFHSSLEMLMMAFDYLDFTGDPSFLKTHLIELTEAILDFYQDAGEFDGVGKYRLISYSTETYHDAVNASPDIAGLRAVLPRAIAHLGKAVSIAKLGEWQQFLDALPELPLRDAQQALPMMPKQAESYGSMGFDVRARTATEPTLVVAPAAELPHSAWNVENPEVYPIFPFRQLGVGQEKLNLAQDTFRYRRFQHDRGWAQDPIIAARVGLVEEAKCLVVGRSQRLHPGVKFPAFWEASFDWIPDQDNGGVFSIALQSMLLQWHEGTLHLLPCWPKEWNVSFRLYAPFQTVVEGIVHQGRLTKLEVTPANRLGDIRLGEGYSLPMDGTATRREGVA